jgi:hypothetical protein
VFDRGLTTPLVPPVAEAVPPPRRRPPLSTSVMNPPPPPPTPNPNIHPWMPPPMLFHHPHSRRSNLKTNSVSWLDRAVGKGSHAPIDFPPKVAADIIESPATGIAVVGIYWALQNTTSGQSRISCPSWTETDQEQRSRIQRGVKIRPGKI